MTGVQTSALPIYTHSRLFVSLGTAVPSKTVQKSVTTAALLLTVYGAGGAPGHAEHRCFEVQHHPQPAGPDQQAVLPEHHPWTGELPANHTLQPAPCCQAGSCDSLTCPPVTLQKLFVPDVGQSEPDSKGSCDPASTNGQPEKGSHVSDVLLNER